MKYPHWVCAECGLEASGGKAFSISCYHNGVCEVCRRRRPVTEARDFYYPKFRRKK